MLKIPPLIAIAFFAGALRAGTSEAAVTQDDFLVRTTGDLVDLCSADRSDPLMTAAVNFCHGFGVGVYRVLAEEQAAQHGSKLFCIPTPTPTRNETVSAFVEWAKANPSHLSEPATDGIADFLAQRFPCQKAR
jgi:hypothetical protein